MRNRPVADSTSVLSFLCYAPSLKQAGPPAFGLFYSNNIDCLVFESLRLAHERSFPISNSVIFA